MVKVFVDGSAGTTGLRIAERLGLRTDIELIRIPEALRKDKMTRQEAIRAAGVAFLCLPDEAAVEAAALAGEDTVVIDTSTAHRTAPGWDYGFPELSGYREKIAASKHIANPGCHASGFIALVEPLIRAGIVGGDADLSCFSLTGYSGGGKKMIAEYEAKERPAAYASPRQYGLTQQHKHLKEMQAVCGLERAPLFCPVVADFYSGMQVTVPLFTRSIRGSVENIKEIYRAYYPGPVVKYGDWAEPMLPANAMAGRDDMLISVTGNEDRILLIASFDNLGKGASGAAIQNMNLVLGLDETAGLNI